jgi:CubicO group peptidase (beta-lactamase class C family)
MVDTAFHVDDSRAGRFAQCYVNSAAGKLVPLPGHSFREPPAMASGGGGLVSTAADYMRFCDCLRCGGTLGEARLIGPKTLALMRANHLPGGVTWPTCRCRCSDATYKGVAWAGFAVTTDAAKTQLAGSLGEYSWGGAASTAFWIDPVEDLSVVFLTQFMPSTLYPVRRELRTMVNAAVLESNAR